MSANSQIRPLKWERHSSETSESYRAETPFGSYTVDRNRIDYIETAKWGSWRWSYCFIEYYDEGSSECSTAAEGKRLAWKDWVGRITPALKGKASP